MFLAFMMLLNKIVCFVLVLRKVAPKSTDRETSCQHGRPLWAWQSPAKDNSSPLRGPSPRPVSEPGVLESSFPTLLPGVIPPPPQSCRFLLCYNARHPHLISRAPHKPRQHIKKQRHHFANKGTYSQSYGFSSSDVQM